MPLPSSTHQFSWSILLAALIDGLFRQMKADVRLAVHSLVSVAVFSMA
jgi:hypothetical protein